jgi:hypothetical protein
MTERANLETNRQRKDRQPSGCFSSKFRYLHYDKTKFEYIGGRGLQLLTKIKIEFTNCVNGLTAALHKRVIDLLKKFTIVAL